MQRKMMYRRFVVLFSGFMILFLSACGGGGGGGGSSSSGTPSVGTSGIAVDPYIYDAQFQEIHEDGSIGQLSSFSGVEVRFKFTEPIAEGSRVVMVDQGIHNGVPYEGNLRSCFDLLDGELVVSPFTTVLTNLIESGLTEQEAKDELVIMLQDAGHNLTAADLTIDPMAGIDQELGLHRLQGAMAVNSWMLAMTTVSEDGFIMSDSDNYLSHLQSRQQLLTDMSVIMENYLGEENYNLLSEALQLGLHEDYPLNIEDIIHAIVTTCDGLAAQATVDGDGYVVFPTVEDGFFEETFMRHYAWRNMHDSTFAQWYEGSDMPVISVAGGFTMDGVIEQMEAGHMMGGQNSDGTWTMGNHWSEIL